MFGMLATKTCDPAGRPAASTFIVATNSERKTLTLVIVDGDDVQTSFPPIRIVTYRAP
jgi:hypothetical protein